MRKDFGIRRYVEIKGIRKSNKGNPTEAAVEQVFKIGSMEPGAMLFDAFKEFEKKSARAEEYIRMIKERLPEALQQCIHTAAGVHEPAIQRSLLQVS
ncbi:PREDICTED: vacuolar protein sorting-associated protein 16 homolog [Acropora digitifera]|uniref:vacuolar protein sorting-associated protein 16 homolog n=1 Tax=Acropora digitifera TaxID=70779 RepID=UPI00077A6975|nr:PREDICTED: vacuolar protein sorting-associated protein 16 homolog [Acropora digitifera]